MEPKHKVNPLTGELQEYVFEYNGILALRNFTAKVEDERLILHAADDVNFSILEALVSEIEINGVVYDNPTAAQEALTRLTFNQNRPVLLDKTLKDLILGAVQKVEGKGLSSNDFTNDYKQQLDALEDYDIELDESTTELKFKKGNNVVRRISLMFLDDEGTKLVYNRTGKSLELRDKRDNLLTSIPVSHFVSNIPTGIVIQNGKIKLMAGSEVIDENAISYNDLADKPDLEYLPLTGGTVNGNINLNGSLLINDKTRVEVRNNGNIAFGNKPFNDLVIGEFKGIQLWGQGNDKVVLAGGEVTNLSELKNENIKVGGRNLMFKSQSFDNSNGWLYQNGGIVERNLQSYNGRNIATKIYLSGRTWDMHKPFTFTEDTEYTLSCWVKLETANNVVFYLNNSNSWDNPLGMLNVKGNLGEWKKVVITFKPQSNLKANIHIGGNEKVTQSAGHILICDMKLEKGNIPTDWSPAPEDLATAEELIRKITRAGYEVGADTVISQAQQNDTVFVKASCTLGLQNIEHLGNTSFRKVFDGGSIIFTCTGKNIIYTGDNTFNGKKGSTAVVSIYNNDCYIDIRNV